MMQPTAPRNSPTGSQSTPITNDTVAVFAMRIAHVGLEFLCGIALARHFGALSYGAYAFAMSCVGLLGVPAAMGFDRFLIREVSVLKSRNEWPVARALIRFSHQAVLIVSILLGGIIFLIAPLFAKAHESQVTDAVQMAMLLVPIMAFARLRQATLQGLGSTVDAYIPESVVQPLALLLALAAWRFVPGGPSSGTVAVALQIVASVTAMVAGMLLLNAKLPLAYYQSTKTSHQTSWLREAFPFVWMLGMNVIMINIDTVVVGLVLGPVAAGSYRAASQMAMLVLLPATTVSIVSAARVATLYASHRQDELERVAISAARVAFGIAIVVAALLVAAGKPALLLFGAEFVHGYRSLTILAAAYAGCSAAGIAGYLLIMTKYEKSVAVVAMLGAVANIALNLILVPCLGMDGAAIATGLSTLGVSACYVCLARSRTGVWATVILSKKC